MARLVAGPGVVDLDRALAALAGPPPAGPDAVVVTFDDGTADFVEEALPILVRHRVPATLYVATDFVERGRPFPGGGAPLSWSTLVDAVSTGLVTVGSHTHTHALLDRLPAGEVDGELDRSITLIGDRLGVESRHFAYPKALGGSPAADRAVRARFTSAAARGHPGQPVRRDRPVSPGPLSCAGGRRARLLRPQGGRGDAHGGRPAAPGQPSPSRERHHLREPLLGRMAKRKLGRAG